MISIKVLRKQSSYDFKVNPKKEGSFDNNWKNNSRDWFILYDDECEIARFRCQSVANYCFGDMASNGDTEHGDTIAPGLFKVKCFVDPRSFHGEIHGIIETKDLDGQWINRNSMQIVNGFQTGRWLIHDKWSNSLKKDTNTAWSAGCIIMSSSDLKSFNDLLHAYKIKSGDIILGAIMEVEK